MEKMKDFFTKIWTYLEKLKKTEKASEIVSAKESKTEILAPIVTLKEVDNTIVSESPKAIKKAPKKKTISKNNKKNK